MKNRRSILGRAKCDRRACRSNTRTLRAQPVQHRSERNAPTWGPSQSPRNPQRLSASNHVKTKDNLRPPLLCGLNQWIKDGGAADRGEYLQAAGAFAEGLICLTKIKVLFPSIIKFLPVELGMKLAVIQPCNAHGTLN